MKTIVCDCGTGFMKCGFAENEAPIVFSTAVGRPVVTRRDVFRSENIQLKAVYVGDEIEEIAAHTAVDITHPIENGVVRDWEGMRLVWEYTFYTRLGLEDLSECQIMLTEAPQNPTANRERMCREMFEHFGFKRVYFVLQGILGLYSCGLQTGVVVDSGDGVTHIVPIFDGYASRPTIRRLDIAGRDVTRQLAKLLCGRGYAFRTDQSLGKARRLKEKHCYVSQDYQTDTKLAKETTVLVCRDGGVMLDYERFAAPEILFSPEKFGKESSGLPAALFSAIQDSGIDMRRELYGNIVLCGGTTMMQGFSERLEKELALLCGKLRGGPGTAKEFGIRVRSPRERSSSVYIGGTVLAGVISEIESAWVTDGEWRRDGAQALSKFQS
ncbi:MAG: actin-related protein 2 [Amphiamblys sp. WSBS2006]|nr:MAG: actin-related protein 2 [Amphiamblys sp. WSBS2006]